MKEPERSCIITREAKPKEDLIRFVVGPDNRVVPDVAGKLPGRGIYVGCSKLLVAEAIAKRAFSKAAKKQVEVPADLIAKLEAQLARRVADSLSMARKAGQVVTGFDQVEEAVKSGKVEALIHASDAGADGIKKLQKLVPSPGGGRLGGGHSRAAVSHGTAVKEEPSPNPLPQGEGLFIVDMLPRALLSEVLGKENAVHAAVTHGPAAAFFIAGARRFALFLA